ncbi:MAG TPA: hypothetical protein VKD91_15230 [Pyrinomonadaceae bacterium]|nr:hypothetical protein [Pyrinomonadaceae bacterium]
MTGSAGDGWHNTALSAAQNGTFTAQYDATYSIYVTPAGGTELTVGTNFAFRTEQSGVTALIGGDWMSTFRILVH